MKQKKKRKINIIFTIILLVTILIFFSLLFYINIIPILYTIIGLIISLIFAFGIILLNFRRIRILRIIGYTLSTIITGLLIFIIVYLFNTIGFLFNVTDGDYVMHTYNILVLKDSDYEKIDDLENLVMGINETTSEEELNKLKKNIEKKIDTRYSEFEDITSLVDGLINRDVASIVLENSELDLLKEETLESYNLLKNIYQIEIKNDISDLKDIININSEPFNIYISGIDTFGSVNRTGRSDVNMVVTINPKTEKAFITWVPRDYYVFINNSSYKDKLTHAGIYGIDSSIYAMEKLLDVNINYYVKVNFTSVIEVVDLLGGITVNNEEAFYFDDGTYFAKGNIKLNGEDALKFVRERKSLSEGDISRGKNQIKVLEAIINKALSPSIIKNYNSLLKSLDNAFVTNMSQNTMIGFIRRELTNKRNWQFSSYTLSGTDSNEYTYSYKNKLLYVMLPNEESVSTAKKNIKEMMEG